MRFSLIRLFLLFLPGLLAGCGVTGAEPAGAFVAASAAAVPVFGRSLPDMVYSGFTGKDCSMVRLEQGKSYCRPVEPPADPPPVCTRSLGTVECWTNPEVFGTALTTVADAPKPTAEQEAWRTRRWPGF
jgi:hypothetical protein